MTEREKKLRLEIIRLEKEVSRLCRELQATQAKLALLSTKEDTC